MELIQSQLEQTREELTATRKELTTARREIARLRRWRRWMTVWIAIFTVGVGWALWDNRDQAASISETQKANCILKGFLLEARRARIIAAGDPKLNEQQQNANERAANSYQLLATALDVTNRCNRQLKERKLL